MNKSILIGRFTRDPEVRYSDNGTSIARFTIAVDRRFKNESGQQADFIGCIAFGKTAEFIEKYFRQGNKIVVEGRIQTGSYTNKEGQTIYTTDIVVESVEFAESKNAGGNNDEKVSKPEPASGDGFMNIGDVDGEELPFN